eukprot:gene371-1004_t
MASNDDMDTQLYDYIFKVIIVGDKRVGKSSLLLRFREGIFDDGCLPPTIGVDFLVCDLQVKNRKVKLQLWDTAGEEEYKAITSVYYRGAHAALIVFDVTRPETFQSAKQWMEDVYTTCGTDVKIIFVGNKCDLSLCIDLNVVKDFTEMNLLYWCQASAKDGTNVEAIFEKVAGDLVELHDQLLSLPSLNNGPGSLFLNGNDARQSSQFCCGNYFTS